MLSRRTVLDSDAIAIEDFACLHPEGRGDAIEPSTRHAIVFVRRGCFIRCVEGVESVLDPTLAYCMNPGEEERFDHPHADGDDCTAIALDPALAASLWGGEETLPSGPLPVPPRLDLAHRLLLAAGRKGGDPDELTERAIAVTGTTLEHADPHRAVVGRPSTARARRVLVDGAREVLAAEPACPLLDLARTLAVSPHHLSRIFRAATGHTISRHRMRLRARAALERLAGGEQDLARLAADVGFADQSHLCRVMRAETGQAPSALRQAIAGPTADPAPLLKAESAARSRAETRSRRPDSIRGPLHYENALGFATSTG
jgi:AraC-like DNA-binding protein